MKPNTVFSNPIFGNENSRRQSNVSLLAPLPVKVNSDESNRAIQNLNSRFAAGETKPEKTPADFLRQILVEQPIKSGKSKSEPLEMKLDKSPQKSTVADYNRAAWRAVFNKAGCGILTDTEIQQAVGAMRDNKLNTEFSGFNIDNLRRKDAKPGAMFVYADKATVESAKRAAQAVLQYQEYKAKQSDANQQRARSEVNQMFADQARVLWNSAVNIAEGAVNTALDAATTGGGTNPLPLLNPNRPQADFSGAKTDYRSEMMRRDLNGKLDGDGIKAGQFIETGVTVLAPIVVGAATAPKAAPQSLKTLGGLPEVEVSTATTQATNVAKTADASRTTSPPSSLKVNKGQQGKHIPGHNNYIQGRSILTEDPKILLQKAGTGQPVNKIPRGQPGFKERVDFSKVIGEYVDPTTGQSVPTTKGILHYGKDGIHIVPARP